MEQTPDVLVHCTANWADLMPVLWAGRACLHHAANYGFENCLDALLVYPGIELDAQDSAGDTALHLAAVNGFPMCAFNLTKAAPQTCLIANNVKETAIDVAVANDRGEVYFSAPICPLSDFKALSASAAPHEIAVLPLELMSSP